MRVQALLEFQSSLELSPECNPLGAIMAIGFLSMFQSSLELSPECNVKESVSLVVAGRVSILTRAFARVQPEAEGGGDAGHAQVSILTRAFARVQQVVPGLPSIGCLRFNPHSSFRPSATERID